MKGLRSWALVQATPARRQNRQQVRQQDRHQVRQLGDDDDNGPTIPTNLDEQQVSPQTAVVLRGVARGAVLTVRLLGGLAVDGPPTIVRVNDAVEVVFLVRGYPRQQNSGRRGSSVIGKCCVHVCPPLDYLLDYGNDGHSNNDRPLAVTPPRAVESPSRRTD
ncbi:hypothetical protein HPB47_025781 [Ixodes persulcatus]|uniref:Uncharacterized protein n=1 Tax=Ixodes persulcatus TaxID=34615 RepID=A0AC60Q2F8_IXOPE|nr:hypothetical protein HPB47_025781 [Ixodes persulcatus]